jgi:hypothetical protein
MDREDLVFMLDYYVETGELYDGVASVENVFCTFAYESWVIVMDDGRHFLIHEAFDPIDA